MRLRAPLREQAIEAPQLILYGQDSTSVKLASFAYLCSMRERITVAVPADDCLFQTGEV